MLKYILSDKWFTFSRFENQTENILSYQNSSEKKKKEEKNFFHRYVTSNTTIEKFFEIKIFPRKFIYSSIETI